MGASLATVARTEETLPGRDRLDQYVIAQYDKIYRFPAPRFPLPRSDRCGCARSEKSRERTWRGKRDGLQGRYDPRGWINIATPLCAADPFSLAVISLA
jgi:hypothetical protein